jgi:hypothetical protein
MTSTAAEIALSNAGLLPQAGQGTAQAEEDGYYETDAFLAGRPPAVKFPQIGDMATGIIQELFLQQERVYNSQDLKFWDDGRPVMQMVVILRMAGQDPDLQALYVGREMRKAIVAAVQVHKVPGLRRGGHLCVRYNADDVPRTVGAKGAKLYDAAYDPPGRKPLGETPQLPVQSALPPLDPPF